MSKNSYDLKCVAVRLVAEPPLVSDSPLVTPEDAVKVFGEHLSQLDREHFVAVHVNNRLKPISYETVSIGSINGSLVSTREVFKAAVLANAYAIMIMHNHPAGSLQPSPEDDQVTRHLCTAGKIMGIPILDHVIIGRGGNYYSYKEQGRILED